MPSEIPASLRRSLLAPLAARGRAEEIERRLVEAIDLGELADGEQLPAESELAAQLGVAPMTLREALAGLRRIGLVETRRGRGGGTFVRVPSDPDRARRRLADSGIDQLRDLGTMREAVAVAAARLATSAASENDVSRLMGHVRALTGAADATHRRLADSRFHIEVALMSGSLRLAKAETELQTSVRPLTWLLLDNDGAGLAVAEHERIAQAIAARDAAGAETAMRDHLQRETATLIAARVDLDRPAAPTTAVWGPRIVLERVERALLPVFALLESTCVDRIEPWLGADGPATGPDLEDWEAHVGAALADPPAPLDGMGIAWRRAFTEAPWRWSWWRRSGDGLSFLPVELDPKHPDYYDYEAAEWFTDPLAAGAPTITGPFLDLGGADDHIFTLAVPVIGPGGKALGVVGADMRVQQLEAIASPLLAALDQPAALVNADDVVVAANSARWLPATRLTLAKGDTRERGGRLGWSVVVAETL